MVRFSECVPVFPRDRLGPAGHLSRKAGVGMYQVKRLIRARERALIQRRRAWVVQPTHEYRVKSRTEDGWHAVERLPDGSWRCDCAGFDYTGLCCHIGAVHRRSDREGWDFGQVALPLQFDEVRA